MDWVGTLGGPLVVVPSTIARRWRGANSFTQFSRIDPRTRSWFDSPRVDDYDRACSIDGALGLLQVGRGHALVLQTLGEPVTFLTTEEAVVIVHVSYSDLDEIGILNLMKATPENLWEPTDHRIRVNRGSLLIFDSVYPGDALPTQLGQGASVPWLRVRLPAGNYRIATATHESRVGTQLIMHRLERDNLAAEVNVAHRN